MKGYQITIKLINNANGKVLFEKILPESCDIKTIQYHNIIEMLSFLYHPLKVTILFEYSEYDDVKPHG